MRGILVFITALCVFGIAYPDYILVPMDKSQKECLKAYGLAYWCLQDTQGFQVKWLLNYRGGSFLMPDDDRTIDKANVMGVETKKITERDFASIVLEIQRSNMEIIILEKAPKLAVYVPPTADPWDDAVRLVLDYAEIPYAMLWDREALEGMLTNYDWVHLHHEDFTGQYGKFFMSFRNAEWYRLQVITSEKEAKSAGYKSVQEHKKAVAKIIKRYVEDGGFLFAMCAAVDTLEIALASDGTDIAPVEIDGTPIEPDCQSKLDFSKTFAFKDFKLELNPMVYEFSDIDYSDYRIPESSGKEDFALFEFSAKEDPVPTMLVQCHAGKVKGFFGQTTSFRKKILKEEVTVLGDIDDERCKYIHGNCGKGTFTFLGGHDPEDYSHIVGESATNIGLYKNSHGYRLILNNVLFPAAKKEKRKT